MNPTINSVSHHGANIIVSGWLKGFQKGDEMTMIVKQDGNKIVVINCLSGPFQLRHPRIPKEMIIKPGSDAGKTCEELWYKTADAVNIPPNPDDDPNIQTIFF